MHKTRTMFAVVALVALAAAPASAATTQAQWTMSPDAASPSEVPSKTGGSSVVLTGRYSAVAGAVGGAIRFDYGSGPALATAKDSSAFNPGSAPFAVAAYVKTDTVPISGAYSPNVVQKGLFGSSGQWKMQLKGTTVGTVADCRFTGSRLPYGDIVEDRTKTPLDNGQWHEVVCWREDNRYGITVDGVDTTRTGNVGVISTPLPLRMANKSPSSGIGDQLQGSIDCVAYAEGPSARSTAASRVPC